MSQCLGITQKGLRCKNKASQNGYCYLHEPSKKPKVSPKKLKLPVPKPAVVKSPPKPVALKSPPKPAVLKSPPKPAVLSPPPAYSPPPLPAYSQPPIPKKPLQRKAASPIRQLSPPSTVKTIVGPLIDSSLASIQDAMILWNEMVDILLPNYVFPLIFEKKRMYSDTIASYANTKDLIDINYERLTQKEQKEMLDLLDQRYQEAIVELKRYNLLSVQVEIKSTYPNRKFEDMSRYVPDLYTLFTDILGEVPSRKNEWKNYSWLLRSRFEAKKMYDTQWKKMYNLEQQILTFGEIVREQKDQTLRKFGLRGPDFIIRQMENYSKYKENFADIFFDLLNQRNTIKEQLLDVRADYIGKSILSGGRVISETNVSEGKMRNLKTVNDFVKFDSSFTDILGLNKWTA